jgi:carnosine N-methyltransferase
MDKAKSTLKQFVRDWSKEVVSWTNVTNYRDLKSDSFVMVQYWGHSTFYLALSRWSRSMSSYTLGRIVYEILRAGYEVQGNELEFCMLMASNMALNE